jgi:hypothetical protein
MSIGLVVLIGVIALGLQTVHPQAKTPPSAHKTADDAVHATLQEAQWFFFNGDYDKTAAVSYVMCAERPDDLDACELRTASLHFQIKKALGETGQRGNNTAAWDACAACPVLMSAFVAETARGQALARGRLKLALMTRRRCSSLERWT